MKHTDAYSDEFLNAYIDDQLDEAERSALLTELKVNDELSRRVCQLRKARDMVQLAYLDVDSDTPSEERHRLLLEFAHFLSTRQDDENWRPFARQQFARAYGDDEPEYGEADLKAELDR